MKAPYLIDRDISWLHFNHRVLQEAMDEMTPLYEKIKFLAIYSSNLDEFFRVRVASLRSFSKLNKSTQKELLETKNLSKTLQKIKAIVEEQQNLFGQVFRRQIRPELEANNIFLIDAAAFTTAHQSFATDYFKEHIEQLLQPTLLLKAEAPPFLKNKGLYFIVDTAVSAMPVLLEIPSDRSDRFVVLPSQGERYYITFLDDIIRYNLPTFLKSEIKGAYSVKVSRDAELYLGDEYEGDLIEQLKRSLDRRNVGVPTRFLYDERMPQALLEYTCAALEIEASELVKGATYHNFNDFFGFPDPTKNPDFRDRPLPPMPHPELSQATSMLELLHQQDVILHFPYQSYAYVPRFIWEAAEDEDVESIKITLYRVASKSEVTQSLLHAVKKGKKVTVFIEAKARFDEASNLYWGDQLKEAGAHVIWSFPGVKVHTKLLLITKEEEEERLKYYTYVGTGNFNEKTAKLYADHALLTTNQKIGREVKQVFDLLSGRVLIPKTKSILVSPFTTRKKFEKLIKKEMKLARAGKKAYMVLKMNSLEDEDMIEMLVEASQAGVQIDMIVRGICRLMPGIEGYTENIRIVSILDRFLEHARVYIFGNNGEEKMYIASADWMTRNLDRRVEVAVPILDEQVYKELRAIIDIQLADNQKARSIEATQSNPYNRDNTGESVRSQTAIYEFLAARVHKK